MENVIEKKIKKNKKIYILNFLDTSIHLIHYCYIEMNKKDFLIQLRSPGI